MVSYMCSAFRSAIRFGKAAENVAAAKGNAKSAENEKILKERLKSHDTAGVYCFSGDELYMMDYYATELSKSAGSLIDVDYFRGKFSFGDFSDAFTTVSVHEAMEFDLDSMSMFGDEDDGAKKKPKSDMKVIKLDEPNFSEWSESDADAFLDMLKNVGRKTVVIVFAPEKEASQSKTHTEIMKGIKKAALCVELCHMQPDDAALVKWLGRTLAKCGVETDTESVRYMINTVGCDMCTLKNEAEKLGIYLASKGKKRLTREAVDFICIKNTDTINFALPNAIQEGNFTMAARELHVFEEKNTPSLIVFGIVASALGNMVKVSYCRKKRMNNAEIASKTGLHPYVVQKTVSALTGRFPGRKEDAFCKFASKRVLDCDRQMKGSPVDNYQLLWFLLFDLCTYR